MPAYCPGFKGEHVFSGKRTHRGLYVSKCGIHVHADINAALNILRKSGLAQFPEGFRAREPCIIKRKAAA